MEINISSRHINLSESMEAYALKKFQKLDRFFDRIQDIGVIVGKPTREFQVEVITRVKHHDPFIASCSGQDFYGCVDNVVDKLVRQVKEHKDKIRNRKHPE